MRTCNRLRVRAPVLVLVALALLLPSTTARVGAQDHTNSKTDELVDLINHARVNAGLLPLARSSELDQAAQGHSVDMVQHDYLDHTGSDGSQPQDRADRAGYHVPANSGWIVVEVISAISGDPQGPVDWWMGDAQHEKVLMNPRWREIGAGYAQGGEYGNYWTALFACRPGVLPTVTLDGISYTHTEECGDPNAAPVAAPTPTPQPSSFAAVTLSVSPTSASAGSDVNVQWRGITSPTSTDWIGLYRPGDPDTTPLAWVYVGCAQQPLDARPLGSCNLPLPQTIGPGQLEVRVFAANAYSRLGAPVSVRVS